MPEKQCRNGKFVFPLLVDGAVKNWKMSIAVNSRCTKNFMCILLWNDLRIYYFSNLSLSFMKSAVFVNWKSNKLFILNRCLKLADKNLFQLASGNLNGKEKNIFFAASPSLLVNEGNSVNSIFILPWSIFFQRLSKIDL